MMTRQPILWLMSGVMLLSLPSETYATKKPVDLLVVRDGWGNVKRETVRKTLESVAAEILPYFPERELPPIIVYPSGGPITLYQRGPLGEIVIRLNTKNTLWSQYSYQFAHELCHVLCEYDADKTGNDWFEESICELASMFVLRKMGQTWKTNPPFSHWKNYAPHLTSYADNLLKKSTREPGRTFAQWYAIHANELHGTAAKRDLNAIVAHQLLPIFEKEPDFWEAVGFLNKAKPKQPQSLKDYLNDWLKHAPRKHHRNIRKVAAEFGFTLNPS